MVNKFYLSAGLPASKSFDQSPTSQVNTNYLSAGLPPEFIADEQIDTTKRLIIQSPNIGNLIFTN